MAAGQGFQASTAITQWLCFNSSVASYGYGSVTAGRSSGVAMQTTAKQTETRADELSKRRGDLFDPYFPNIRAASKVVFVMREPSVYDPHFPAQSRTKGAAHV